MARRPSTLQHADRILVLNESRLVATGTHETLFETNGFYRKSGMA